MSIGDRDYYFGMFVENRSISNNMTTLGGLGPTNGRREAFEGGSVIFACDFGYQKFENTH